MSRHHAVQVAPPAVTGTRPLDEPEARRARLVVRQDRPPGGAARRHVEQAAGKLKSGCTRHVAETTALRSQRRRMRKVVAILARPAMTGVRPPPWPPGTPWRRGDN